MQGLRMGGYNYLIFQNIYYQLPHLSEHSLPNLVVTANNTNVFLKRLDQYWQHQDIIYDFRAQIELKEPEVAVMFLE